MNDSDDLPRWLTLDPASYRGGGVMSRRPQRGISVNDSDDKRETFVNTEAGMIRVVWDLRGGTRRVRAFLNGNLITDEEAERLGVDMRPDGGVAGKRNSSMGY